MDIGGQKIIVDGAHNPAGAKALREALDSIFPTEPRTFLLGILHDKAVEEMLDILLRPEDAVIVTQPDSERAEMPEQLLRSVRKRVRIAEAEPDRGSALARAFAAAKGKILCCTGSLYLIGDLRERIVAWKEEAWDAGIGNAEHH
jgi:dihydrofolate synthase/folylpolyglutamate synthase